MTLVDVYDALRSIRPYKKAIEHLEVIEMIKKESGTHFDPDIVNAFIEINEQFDVIYNSLIS